MVASLEPSVVACSLDVSVKFSALPRPRGDTGYVVSLPQE